MERVVLGKVVVAGEARGTLVLSQQPISLWGGMRPETGELIDERHDRCGVNVAGKVFAFPAEKGSSTGSAVLLEAIRRGVSPAAILTIKTAPIVALGAVVAQELWGRTAPVVGYLA